VPIGLAFVIPCGADVKRRKLARAKIRVVSNRKPLSVRYAELLRLRQAVFKAQSENEHVLADRRRSN
jgi:hypothetical protein